ncbi:MAG: hypothetical protein EB127_30855, partial [Alphaproteobacteria bacterium]|nr:hypothetical protein [Alphaproteobacteria bacterium]
NEPFVGPAKLSISSDYRLNTTTVSDISFVFSQNSSGITTDTDIKYGIFFGAGYYEILENGTNVASDHTYNVTRDTVASIIYDGTSVKYYIDGILKYTSSVLPTGPLYAYAFMYGLDNKFKNFHADHIVTGAFGQGTFSMTGVNATILSSDSAISTGNPGYVRVNEPFIGPAKLSFSSDYMLNTTIVSAIIVGLSQNSSGSITDTDFKYGIVIDSNAVVVVEYGIPMFEDYTYNVTPDTVGSIIYDGTSVKYYIDGTLKYTSTLLPTGPLYAYVFIYLLDGKFKNFHADQLLLGTNGATGAFGQGTFSMTGVNATILSSDSAISTSSNEGGYVRVNEPFVGPAKLSISSDYRLNTTTVSDISFVFSQN